MASEAHHRHHTARFDAARGGTPARSGAMPGRLLRAARIRPLAGRGRGARRRKAARALVVPTVRYRDVPAAIAWLCAAFGMQEHRVVAGEDGAPRFAQLQFGASLLMIAPIEDTPFGRLMVQPDEIGGVETQVCYLFVEDAHAHYLRAKAAGAEIVLDIDEEANGGRGYSCRDPEGHVWNFGTYDPWQDRCGEPRGQDPQPHREKHGLAALVLLSLAAVLTAEAMPAPPDARAGAVVADARAKEAVTVERHRREPVQRSGEGPGKGEAAPAEDRRRAALLAAERTAEEARGKLAQAQGAQQKAERFAAATLAQLEGTRRAKEAAERAAAQARRRLAAAEKSAEEARAHAALEREKRLASERAAARARRRVASFRLVRPRPRVWCYRPNAPNPASIGRARLSGFCKD